MTLIDISSIVNTVIPILMVTIALGILIYKIMKKKGLIYRNKKDLSDVDISKAKTKDISMFNIIDDFQGEFVVTEGNTCFTTGVKCEGIGLDKMDRVGQQRVADGHVVIYNMLTWGTQMYIQSRQMDVESNKRFWEGAKDKVEKALKEVDEKIRTLESFIVEDDEENMRNQEIEEELMPLVIKRKGLLKQFQGKMEELAYENACSSPDSPQQFDTYFLYSYRHDASAFSTNLTNEEILDKARQYLDSKIETTIKNFEDIGVKAQKLDKLKCTELLYRAYNPIECDIVTFDTYSEFKTSAFELYTSTDNVFTPSYRDKNPEKIGGAA